MTSHLTLERSKTAMLIVPILLSASAPAPVPGFGLWALASGCPRHLTQVLTHPASCYSLLGAWGNLPSASQCAQFLPLASDWSAIVGVVRCTWTRMDRCPASIFNSLSPLIVFGWFLFCFLFPVSFCSSSICKYDNPLLKSNQVASKNLSRFQEITFRQLAFCCKHIVLSLACRINSTASSSSKKRRHRLSPPLEPPVHFEQLLIDSSLRATYY